MVRRHTLSLYLELKSWGVVQVAVAYIVVAWLLVQVADTILPAFSTPEWAILGLLPVATALAAMLTARLTVLGTLAKLP